MISTALQSLKSANETSIGNDPDKPRVKAALFGNVGPGGESIQHVYGSKRLDFLMESTDLFGTIITTENIDSLLGDLTHIEVIFSTWGMFPLTEEHLDCMPNLRAVFYAAGSVRYFAQNLIERGITVVSAWAANAIPVAEFTVAQIVLANKGYFQNIREYTGAPQYSKAFRGSGNYGRTVALLGAGQIGRKVVELLAPYHLNVLVFDPFLTCTAAEALGVEKIELAEAFSRAQVVSNHLANVPETKSILTGDLFASLPANATFINTGRGATVDEPEMVAVLKARPDITALLDVTDPEPCPTDAVMRTLPNVYISSHIAGSINDEVQRMADLVLNEFELWKSGLPLQYSVTRHLLETMA